MNYLAIDLGAESGRIILGRVSSDKIVLEEIHRFPNIPLRNGSSISWDIPRIWSEIHSGLATIINTPIHSVSVDSWGVDYVLLDAAGSPQAPTHHYRDPRTKIGVEKFLAKVSWPVVFEETGIQFMPINTLFQLAAESRERIAKAHQILGIADAFNHFLGGAPRIEESLASTFQLYNPRRGAWSELLLRELELPRQKLARVTPSGSVIGELSGKLGVDSLSDAQVVATCSHDTGCAVAAVPATEPNWAYLSSGTWSLMGVERAEPIINDQSRELNFTNEIGYGGSIRLLKNISGLWLLQECRRNWAEQGQQYDYAEITRLAEAEPPTGAIIDPTDPRFLAPNSMLDAIAEFCRERSRPIPTSVGAVTRCIFESLARLYRLTLEQLEILTHSKIERLHVVGGGSKNALLNQLTADACGIPVLAGPVEATALGNILIQAITAGEIANLAAARMLIRKSCPLVTFTPRRN